MTNKNSFLYIRKRIKQIESNNQNNICKALVGNNCDLTNRVVTENEGKKLANDFKISFFEVSTRTKQNIKEVFNCMILEMINNVENNIKKN